MKAPLPLRRHRRSSHQDRLQHQRCVFVFLLCFPPFVSCGVNLLSSLFHVSSPPGLTLCFTLSHIVLPSQCAAPSPRLQRLLCSHAIISIAFRRAPAETTIRPCLDAARTAVVAFCEAILEHSVELALCLQHTAAFDPGTRANGESCVIFFLELLPTLPHFFFCLGCSNYVVVCEMAPLSWKKCCRKRTSKNPVMLPLPKSFACGARSVGMMS